MPKYRLYYAGLDTPTGTEQVGLAYSDDLVSWTRASDAPVIPVGLSGAADAAQTSNPFVLRKQGGFRMWYQGKATDGLVSICYAESADGVSWKAFPDRVFSPEGERTGEYREGYQHPHVLIEDGVYHLWFSIQAGGKASIAHASSRDGYSWGKPLVVLSPEAPWEGNYLYYPFVRKVEEGYELWYTGRAKGRMWRTGRAVSPDGVVFVRDPENPVLPACDSSSLLRSLSNRLGFLYAEAQPALFGSGSPCLFLLNGEERMLTHDAGVRGRLSISLYRNDEQAWEPVARHVLRTGASSWDAYFQADPFILV